jgi:endogenous inhibitor of DNA gyrase (YacG/DUF329 family)
MPHVRNYYHRPVKCPLCQKTIEQENQWFCSIQCEEEWKALNKEIKIEENKKVRGMDTSS